MSSPASAILPPKRVVTPMTEFDKRRLADAVATEQRQRLAVLNREAEALDDQRLAVAGAQVLDPEQLSQLAEKAQPCASSPR